jgi:hypothetical protein
LSRIAVRTTSEPVGTLDLPASSAFSRNSLNWSIWP